MKGKQWLYFAPRSNETSRAHFLATLETGYPRADVFRFLSESENTILGERQKLYIWGNKEGKADSWRYMELGDYVAFYAKGTFVYVGKCILKKHSAELARHLWGNDSKDNQTWEYTYFLDEIRPISIPLATFQEFGAYKKKMVVQGFMPLKKVGMDVIVSRYGGLERFLDSYSTALTEKELLILQTASEHKDTTVEELANLDQVIRDKDLDAQILHWQQAQHNVSPEAIVRKSLAIKRNATIVKQMKARYKNKCQICGFTFKKKEGGYYSELAHIKPISTKEIGVDAPMNMVVLCPNHHKMLDHGHLEIVSREEYKIGADKLRLAEPLLAICTICFPQRLLAPEEFLGHEHQMDDAVEDN